MARVDARCGLKPLLGATGAVPAQLVEGFPMYGRLPHEPDPTGHPACDRSYTRDQIHAPPTHVGTLRRGLRHLTRVQ